MEITTCSFFIKGEICIAVRTTEFRLDVVEIIINDFVSKPWTEIVLQKYELTKLFSKLKRLYKKPPTNHPYSLRVLFSRFLKKINFNFVEKEKYIIQSENSGQTVALSEFVVYKLMEIEADLYKIISELEHKEPISNKFEHFIK